MGDIFGGGTPTSQNYEIRGTVDYVDASSRSIYLRNVSGTSMLSGGSGGSGNSVRVYYDNQTAVQFGGQNYRPEDLERGDEVTVRVAEGTNNSLMADTVTVTHDVSGGNSGGGLYGNSNMLRGTVVNVDNSRRTVEIDPVSGSNHIVEFGTNTPVYFNGQTYRVSDLERGDEIEIRVSSLGNNRFSASDITVLRSVSGTSSGMGSSSSMSTVRGTVAHVDTSRRTIEIESASWINRFNTGTGSGSSRMVVSYDNNVQVDVAGRLHPVSGLERGDVVEIQVANSGSSSNVLRATRIFLVRDVNDLR